MGGISSLQMFTLLSFLVFIVVLAVRTLKIIRTPLNLRWELMPIPHEKGRYYYGGSHLEETDYWKHKPEKSKVSELLAMGEEIFFIKSLFEKNRQLWWVSYPFHTGLYILVVFFAALLAGAAMQASGVSVTAGGGFFSSLVHYVTIIAGPFGMLLAAVGCAGLLIKRITRKELRLYSIPADYFNLLIILALLVASLIAWRTADPSFAYLREYLAGTLTFSPAASANGAMTAQIVLAGILFIYMPFTHMIHFMAKYFAYHHIRWADDPNTPGSEVEKKVLKQLGYKVTWAAPHIKKNATWAEAATDTERPENDEKSN